MAVDTGFINAVGSIQNNANGVTNSLFNVLDPDKRKQIEQQRLIDQQGQQNQLLQGQNQQAELQASAQKRQDIQQIIQGSTFVNPATGQPELDHKAFVAAVSTKYPEDAQKFQTTDSQNAHFQAQTNQLNSKTEIEQQEGLTDLLHTGVNNPKLRPFLVDYSKLANSPMTKLLEQASSPNLTPEEQNKAWASLGMNSKLALENAKVKIRELEAQNSANRNDVMSDKTTLNAATEQNKRTKIVNNQQVDLPDSGNADRFANRPIAYNPGQLPQGQASQPAPEQNQQSGIQPIVPPINGATNTNLPTLNKYLTQTGYNPQQSSQNKRATAAPIDGLKTPEQQKKEEENKELLKQIQISNRSIAEARKLIPQASAGMIDSARDTVYRATGKGTPGAVAASRLKVLAGDIRKAIKLAPGAQSNIELLDRLEQIGDIANASKSQEERSAALEEYAKIQAQLEAQVKASLGQNDKSQQPKSIKDLVIPKSASQQSQPVKLTSIEQASKLPKGTEFIDPNGVRRRK